MVQTYVPPPSPDQPSSPNPSTPSDNPSVKEGVLSLWIQSGCEAGDGMVKEMVRYSNINILEQVGHSIMSQANQSNQGVLSLLN